MTARDQHVIDFYVNHPISAEHIMARLKEAPGSLDTVTPEELYPLDEDHYGALEAIEALADRTRMAPGDRPRKATSSKTTPLSSATCRATSWAARA